MTESQIFEVFKSFGWALFYTPEGTIYEYLNGLKCFSFDLYETFKADESSGLNQAIVTYLDSEEVELTINVFAKDVDYRLIQNLTFAMPEAAEELAAILKYVKLLKRTEQPPLPSDEELQTLLETQEYGTEIDFA